MVTMPVLSTTYAPIRGWGFEISHWRFGVEEYAYPIPQGAEGILRETRILVGPTDFSIPGVTAVQVLSLAVIVVLALIASVAIFMTRQRAGRTDG